MSTVTTMANEFQLPTEVLGEVFCSIPVPELKEVSLTCRFFRSLALRQIFKVFTFVPFTVKSIHTGLGVLSARPIALGDRAAQEARQALRFFTSATISPYVRHCKAVPAQGPIYLQAHPTSNPYTLFDELIEILPQFLNLVTVEFAYMTFDSTRLAQIGNLQVYKQLSFINCKVDIPHDLRVPFLRVQNIHFDYPESILEEYPLEDWIHLFHRDHLESVVVIDEGGTKSFFPPALSLQEFPKLRSIFLQSFNNKTCHQLSPLLAKFPSLTHLRLSIAADLSGLRTVDPQTSQHYQPRIQAYEGPYELLHDVANADLRTLSLSLDYRSCTENLAVKLASNANSLTNLAFLRLELGHITRELLITIRSSFSSLTSLVIAAISDLPNLQFVTCDTLSDNLEHVYLNANAQDEVASCIERLVNHVSLKSITLTQRKMSVYLAKRVKSSTWERFVADVEPYPPSAFNESIYQAARWFYGEEILHALYF